MEAGHSSRCARTRCGSIPPLFSVLLCTYVRVYVCVRVSCVCVSLCFAWRIYPRGCWHSCMLTNTDLASISHCTCTHSNMRMPWRTPMATPSHTGYADWVHHAVPKRGHDLVALNDRGSQFIVSAGVCFNRPCVPLVSCRSAHASIISLFSRNPA
jgi:hypothetical protein